MNSHKDKLTTKTYIILVCYYQVYLADALRALNKLFDLEHPDTSLIIVNNNKQVDTTNIQETYTSLKVIEGSNRNWEFSAWDEGINYLKTIANIDDSLIVFANDTFCKHRVFSAIDVALFKRGFTKAADNKNTIVGELNSTAKNMTILGEELKGWLTTYLFAINGHSLNKILPFSKAEDVFNKIDLIDFNNRKVNLDNCSDSFITHIEQWLLPSEPNKGWYKSQSKEVDQLLTKNKLLAILNEKLLALTAQQQHLTIYNVYKPFWAKMYLKLRYELYKIFY